MRNKLLAAVAAAVLCVLPAAACAEDQAAQLLAGLEAEMATVRTLTADFVQEKHLSIFNDTMVLRGSLALAKPQKLAWRVDAPMRSVMIMEDERLRQWDEETGKVMTIAANRSPSMQAAFAQMKGWFYGNYRSLLADYTVSASSQQPLVLVFVPKEHAAAREFIISVVISFGADRRYLQKLEINEKGGDTTVLTFSAVRLNEPLAPSVWKMP